jgi:hypothetical protein
MSLLLVEQRVQTILNPYDDSKNIKVILWPQTLPRKIDNGMGST